MPFFMSDESLKLLLFGGKGGVGKTTTAAATALHWAAQRPERRALIVSTDPAHSLSDSFNQPIGDEIRPISGMPNLLALEMAAGRRLDSFKRRHGEVLKTIADRGTYFDQQDVALFFDLSLPGLDELMAVIEVADIVREGQYDLVILDTAPTGHTLRLLALPQLMADWVRLLDLMLQKHRYMISAFGRYHPDETDAFLEHMSSSLRHLRALLRDANATEFVPVTVAEAMSIEETARLLESLGKFGLRVRTIVVNRVVTRRECPFCEARRGGQEQHLEEIKRRFSAWNLMLLPLLPREVRGQKALERYAQAMLGVEMEGILRPLPSLPYSPSPPLRIGTGRGSCDRVAVGGGPALAHQQLILFGGKGGVGKTTLAAATAIHLARENSGQKTLLFSVDPAHSLSDSLDQVIGSRITPVIGVKGLFALEMEAPDLLEELREEYTTEIDGVFSAFLGDSFDAPFDRQVLKELVSLTPPGLDELMALMKIMEFMEKGAFDHYVLDLAPTGHALRFLETPSMLRQWFIAFFKLLLKYQGVAQLTGVAMMLRKLSKQLRRVQQLLSDAERCQFMAVVTPEAMALLETDRLLHRLAELSIAHPWVVVNMAMPSTTCAFCATMQNEQRLILRQIEQCLDEPGTLAAGLVHVPLFPHEIRGLTGLDRITEVVYGDSNGQGLAIAGNGQTDGPAETEDGRGL
jgi:arsenite-transporting ATPase